MNAATAIAIKTTNQTGWTPRGPRTKRKKQRKMEKEAAISFHL
jgi:hypothetical protein